MHQYWKVHTRKKALKLFPYKTNSVVGFFPSIKGNDYLVIFSLVGIAGFAHRKSWNQSLASPIKIQAVCPKVWEHESRYQSD